jgi:hypothetical protein
VDIANVSDIHEKVKVNVNRNEIADFIAKFEGFRLKSYWDFSKFSI